tara:strand:+ start:131 stop:592 length:462 start_codon:yes stop_codon:yes gene_type:complete
MNLNIYIGIFKLITIYMMAALYIIVGVKHFLNIDFFIAITPNFIGLKKEVVIISGVVEIVLGILILFKKTRKLASIGIIILLILVFPANIYLYVSEISRELVGISKNKALIRMPFQIPLIILSYWHSMEKCSDKFSIFCIILFIPTILYFATL